MTNVTRGNIMGLSISKNGKIRDITLPSQRKVRSSDEQNVEFEDVLHKNQQQPQGNKQDHKGENQQSDHKKEHHTSLSSGIKNYQRNTPHTTHRRHVTARDIGSTPIISINPNQTVGRALEMMTHYKIHHLVLLDDKKILKGILSDRDILNKRNHDLVSQHAQTEVILTKESTEMKIVAKLMLEKGVSALPLINQDNIVTGIITKTDILEYLVHNMPFETYV